MTNPMEDGKNSTKLPPEAGKKPKWRAPAIVAVALVTTSFIGSMFIDKPETVVNRTIGAATPDTPKLLPADVRARCTNTLSSITGPGKMIERRVGNHRAEIAEQMWARTPAHEKRLLLQTLACSAFGKNFSDMTDDEAVFVYGYYSGKRLGILTPRGPDF